MYPAHNPRPDLSIQQKLDDIDWIGTFLGGAVFVLFMIVVTFSGSTYPWKSAACISLWAIFGGILITYIMQQCLSILTTKEQRNFPVHFLKSRTLILLFSATAGGAAALDIVLYYTPLFFQFTRGDSALKAAIRLLPFICAFIFFVMVSGGTLPIIGRYNLYYLIGGTLIVIGGGLLCTINVNTSAGLIYGYEILVGSGVGLVFQNAYAVGAAKVPHKDQPKVIGFINVAQIGTIAIALAIMGCLFQNIGVKELDGAFAGYDFPDAYIRSALAGNLSPVFKSTDGEVVHIAVVAVATTIRKLMATVVAAGAVVLVSSVLMPFEKIDLNIDIVAGG